MNTLTDAETRTGRLSLPADRLRTLPRRQLPWMAAQTLALVVLSMALPTATHPAYAAALGLLFGALVAEPRFWRTLPFTAPGVLAATAGALYVGISGLFGAGLVTGLGLAASRVGAREPWKLAETALAGAVLAPLGHLAAHGLGPHMPTWLAPGLTAFVASLVSAQTLFFLDLDWREMARIPSPRRIRATLRDPFRSACLRAHELDGSLRRYAPDRATREGLGEIAAWIYRLSLSLQAMDDELEELPEEHIQHRIATMEEAAAGTGDSFTRDRRHAAQRHLEGLLRHRHALVVEKERTESLVEYAMATLEEARTSLFYTRRVPGHPTPRGVDEVLDRLRSYSAEETARRDAVRELEQVR